MLQYLTPATLEVMYQDLDEARLALLPTVTKENMIEKAAEYHELTNLTQEIDKQYKALTGEDLWIKMALASTEEL